MFLVKKIAKLQRESPQLSETGDTGGSRRRQQWRTNIRFSYVNWESGREDDADDDDDDDDMDVESNDSQANLKNVDDKDDKDDG